VTIERDPRVQRHIVPCPENGKSHDCAVETIEGMFVETYDDLIREAQQRQHEHERWRYDVALGFALRTLDEQQGGAFMEAWDANLPEEELVSLRGNRSTDADN